MEVWRKFLSTPSARRATLIAAQEANDEQISIHALREEGDLRPVGHRHRQHGISIHALREEGDACRRHHAYSQAISIHALREEGDLSVLDTSVTATVFLSTPSARRATLPEAGTQPEPQPISIHALREEGDNEFLDQRRSLFDFYPRPPRGGRPGCLIVGRQILQISIHALREEGDLNEIWSFGAVSDISIHALREEGDSATFSLTTIRLPFLSTPSARRATAKTETKSLFSNKLYNILHEFRRALIYNGSKNYPNHAK